MVQFSGRYSDDAQRGCGKTSANGAPTVTRRWPGAPDVAGSKSNDEAPRRFLLRRGHRGAAKRRFWLAEPMMMMMMMMMMRWAVDVPA
jgi:hypothetical protein